MGADAGRLEVQISALGDWDIAKDPLASACRFTLEAEGCVEGEVSITLLDDDRIAELNSEYFGKTAPTDVIAFPLFGEGETLLGDVYLGFEQASRQASDLGVPLHEELLRLTIHGTLHVLGHTHPEGPDRAEGPMFRRQEELLSQFLSSRPG